MRLQLGNLAYTPQISNLFRLTSWVLDFVIIMAFTIAPLGMDMTHTNKRTSFPAKYDFFSFYFEKAPLSRHENPLSLPQKKGSNGSGDDIKKSRPRHHPKPFYM